MSTKDDEENNTDTEFDPTDIEKNITEHDTKPTLTLNCIENPDTLSCDFKKKDYDYNVELDNKNFYIQFLDPKANAYYWYNPLTGHATWTNPNQQQEKPPIPQQYLEEIEKINKEIDESNSSSPDSSQASSLASSPESSGQSTEGGKKTKSRRITKRTKRTKKTKRTKTKRTKRTTK